MVFPLDKNNSHIKCYSRICKNCSKVSALLKIQKCMWSKEFVSKLILNEPIFGKAVIKYGQMLKQHALHTLWEAVFRLEDREKYSRKLCFIIIM